MCNLSSTNSRRQSRRNDYLDLIAQKGRKNECGLSKGLKIAVGTEKNSRNARNSTSMTERWRRLLMPSSQLSVGTDGFHVGHAGLAKSVQLG
ncbi:hypothetical protein J6590_069868 [Homalodisca vitripennis]|nr:hypothetical protein J6590_069868 [Homalodisca vitripennis]